MAKHAHTTPHTRRDALLFGGALSALGLTATSASSFPAHPDAALLALRPALDAAVAEVSAVECESGVSDERAARAAEALNDVCSVIVRAQPAKLADGQALKAAAAMHLFVQQFHSEGEWIGLGEELAWETLSEIAGSAYVPVLMPERLGDWSAPRPFLTV